MAEETMFRFLHIRPGRRTERDVSIAARIPLYPEGVTTPFGFSYSQCHRSKYLATDMPSQIGQRLSDR